MADGEKVAEEVPSRGADWEVVNLTQSIYTDAPAPDEQESSDASSSPSSTNDSVFPPSQHENLPIVSEFTENPSENEALEVSCAVKDDGVSDATYEENVQEKSDAADLDESQFVEKARSLAIDDIEFKQGKGLQGMNLVSEEEGIYVDPEFSVVNAGTDGNGDEPTERSLESPPQYAKLDEEDNKIVPSCHCPCQRTWKRCAERLYLQAKETNTFRSVAVAAAMMGLVILGQRWRRNKWHLHQPTWQFNLTHERMSKLLGPINRFKDVLVGVHQRTPLLGGGGFISSL
ncbi:ATG8-interacting protein 1-like [Typha latifolia]|uniref:ATG8-interacting protein 1-like n=1 Tax=Typha latifolia TaxID=4733 RepID=UPI003C2FC999